MTWPRCLTKKAEPPPTRGVNRDSGTASANGGWLRRLVRPLVSHPVVSGAFVMPHQKAADKSKRQRIGGSTANCLAGHS